MTVFLFGAISCSTLYLLGKFSNFNIFEVEPTFRKSPNAILKILPITTLSKEEAFRASKDDIIVRSLERSADINEKDVNNIVNTNAMLLLSEVVEEASRVSRIQQEKHSGEHEQEL